MTIELKPPYVAQLGQTKSGPPNEDEWGEIYRACKALIEKLGCLQWQDRHIAFDEYSKLIDALNARGTKQHIPL